MVATSLFEVNAWEMPRKPLARGKTRQLRKSSGRLLTNPSAGIGYS
jgi:hypothetical protein